MSHKIDSSNLIQSGVGSHYIHRSSSYISRSRSQTKTFYRAGVSLQADPYIHEKNILVSAQKERDALPPVTKLHSHKLAEAQVDYDVDHGFVNDVHKRQRRLAT